MNMIVGINTAFLSFIPSAGSSISIALIVIILYFILSIICIGLCLKQKNGLLKIDN